MNIKFTLTEVDYLNYTKFACSKLTNSTASTKTAFLKNVLLWFIIGLVLVSILRGNDIKLSGLHWPTAFKVAVPFVLFIFFVFFNVKKIQKKSVPNLNGLILGDRELDIGDEGITETSQLGYSFYKWDAVEDVSSNNGDVYIFLDKLLAQIIPSSSFKSEEERLHLIEYLKEKSTVIKHSK